jgi:hypothetical protein
MLNSISGQTTAETVNGEFGAEMRKRGKQI